MTVHHFRRGLMSRRSLLALLGAAPAGLALSSLLPGGAARAAGGELNIYSWPDYFSTGNLANYAKKTGVTPNVSTYDSNETLFAKLNSPAGDGFDLSTSIAGPTLSLIHI